MCLVPPAMGCDNISEAVSVGEAHEVLIAQGLGCMKHSGKDSSLKLRESTEEKTNQPFKVELAHGSANFW